MSVKSHANISTLWIESSSNIPFETIIAQSEKLDHVRLYNVEWETANEASLQSFYNKMLHIATNVQNANAILGSDQNTTYHLLNTDYNFDEEKQSVVYKEITESEYEQLSK